MRSVLQRALIPIRIWQPSIRGIRILSKEQLHNIINSEFPGLRRNPRYQEFLSNARIHLSLIDRLRKRKFIYHGEIVQISRELRVPRYLVSIYIREERHPRLYRLIESGISKTEAKRILEKIHLNINYLNSWLEVKQRLETYYLFSFHQGSAKYHKRIHQCKQYFKTLKLIKKGGCFSDIARAINKDVVQVLNWRDGDKPDLIRLASQIPKNKPSFGHKWLPLKMTGPFEPVNFIQVPTKISSFKQIQNVLRQIKPLHTKVTKFWRKTFGQISREEAFFYILGLIVSDFGKEKPQISSTELVLFLSKKYSWSKRLGDAACYYLSRIGIEAQNRDHNLSSTRTCFKWRSQFSPLITWIIHTCLGLHSHERTSYDAIRVKWILNTPQNLQCTFLQGLFDGDGFASIKSQYIGVDCRPNSSLVKKLLLKNGINARIQGSQVRILAQEDIIRAAKIPLFRYATSRKNNAEKLSEMILIRQKQNWNNISPDVVEEMIKLRRKGVSFGKIAEFIFSKYRISLNRTSIRNRILKKIIKD